MTTTDHGDEMTALFFGSAACNSTGALTSSRGKPRQLPLWPHGLPRGQQRRSNDLVALPWQVVAEMLPANQSLEFTAEHGWRIVPLTAEARRALELLDIDEGDVIPDPVMLERRRRHTEAQLLLEQAQAVLRAVQADVETAATLRRRFTPQHLEETG